MYKYILYIMYRLIFFFKCVNIDSITINIDWLIHFKILYIIFMSNCYHNEYTMEILIHQ
jgi:hypothetical protein